MPPMACVRSNTTGCTSVRARSSNAAVRPAGPAPAITAIFLWDIGWGRKEQGGGSAPASALKTPLASSEQQWWTAASTEVHRRCLYSRYHARAGQQPQLRNGPSRHRRDEWKIAQIHGHAREGAMDDDLRDHAR